MQRFFAARVTDAFRRGDLVGQVNERLVTKLNEGAAIDDLERFAFGVARNVLQEHWRERKRSVEREATLSSTAENLGKELSGTIDTGPQTRNALLAALKECLVALPDSDRSIAEKCYAGASSKENRAALAAELGISRNALDVRISRIRARLEQCVRSKLR